MGLHNNNANQPKQRVNLKHGSVPSYTDDESDPEFGHYDADAIEKRYGNTKEDDDNQGGNTLEDHDSDHTMGDSGTDDGLGMGDIETIYGNTIEDPDDNNTREHPPSTGNTMENDYDYDNDDSGTDDGLTMGDIDNIESTS